jgi:hypothetical protein
VVIDNFYIDRSAVAPNKAQVPLVIDAQTVLTFSVPRQRLKSVARRDSQKV